MIEVLPTVTSTNAVARERVAAGAPHGYTLRAASQTAGRGQRGHGWASPEGGLYLSVVLRPGVPQHLMTGLPVACSLGVLRALEAQGFKGIRLKWPNDLVVGDAKLAGMLAEAGWSPEGVYAVFGVGINVTVPEVAGDAPHALAPTGLAALVGEGKALPSLEDLAIAVRDGVVASVDEWAAALKAAGSAALPLASLMDEYYDRMAFMGECVALIDREGRPYAAGTLTGVDAWGRAVVRMDEQGTEESFDSAQVSLRPLG